MESTWGLVIFLWGTLILGMIILFAYEFGKTPEQKEEDAAKSRERREARRQEEQRRKQRALDNAPAKGCLQSTFEFGCACLFLFLAVIICIMMIISTEL